MNAMPTPWLSGWSGRQGKILILGNIRSYIRAQGHREIVLSPLVVKLDDDNARSVTLGHQLTIVTAQVKKILRYGDDLQTGTFLRTGSALLRTPLQVADILRFIAPRQPRRLNVQVSRILQAAASDTPSIAGNYSFVSLK